MHHHLYPSEDTYISNLVGFEDKNFGLNEILKIGTDNKNLRVKETTKDYDYSGVVWTNYCATDFTGTLTGSFIGSAASVNGIVVSSASFSSSYFSGSIDGDPIAEVSGSVSGSISGSITGSLFSYSFPDFNGELTNSVGIFNGTVTGTDTRNETWWHTTSSKYAERTLIKFNLDSISSSIASGEIVGATFKLNLKVSNEYELPISYKIYAFPISQSWIMGNGYYYHGGSDTGASWEFRDKSSGSYWASPITTSIRPVINFLDFDANSSASFNYGGGTWYYSSSTEPIGATQSFNYESADISMDVTPMVKAWLSGSVPNNGFILMSSDEVLATGSGFALSFYGKETNSINSPYLDVMWEDWSWESGSVGTSSVVITSSYSGMSVNAQTGSTFSIGGGINGAFSSSIFFTQNVHYVTASGNFLNSQLVQLFTGSVSGSLNGTASYVSGSISGSGQFTASYFSGSIAGTNYEYNNTGITGSSINGFISGSLETTGSIAFYVGTVTSSAIIINAGITGSYLDTTYNYMNGLIQGIGLSGNVEGLPIVGPVSGTISIAPSVIASGCGNTYLGYIVSASILSGVFNGSMISGYYAENKLKLANITGSWTTSSIAGSKVLIPLPSGIDPYAYANVYGTYIWGKALGTYIISSSVGVVGAESASFSGQFIEGPLIGGYIDMQLSGSVYTSSYQYTSSMTTTASFLNPLDVNKGFTVIVKNLQPNYKGGDLVRINVFGRKEFPTKTFEKTSQLSGYTTPEALPTSSYYAIKDNLSEEIIMDFDQFTRLSCEYPEGNYFLMDTTGLAQERPYRILIKIQDGSSIYTFDNGDVFKIIR